MADDPLHLLDKRIKDLLAVIRKLDGENVRLRRKLKEVEGTLAKQELDVSRWEGERDLVRARIQGVLSDLEPVGSLTPNRFEVLRENRS